jgi:hypothetical protein
MKRNTMNRSSNWWGRILWLVMAAVWFGVAAGPASAAPDPETCAARPENRQLDYWLGDWSVTYPGAPAASSSTVSLTLDKCVVVENWSGSKGHQGQNMFAYSADDKKWHGMFADNEGRVHVFEGKVTGGTAEFYGPSVGSNGEAVLNRIKIKRVGANEVEQTWEKSTDNGTTWNKSFAGEYARMNP